MSRIRHTDRRLINFITFGDDTDYKLPELTHNIQIYTNVYDRGNIEQTDYLKLKDNKTIQDAKPLFIYLSNETNSGYKGNSGSGSAEISKYENSFGIITGIKDIGGFPSLDIFKKSNNDYSFEIIIKTGINNEKLKINGNTPRTIIYKLFAALITLLNTGRYNSVIIPTDSVNNIATAIFNPGMDVKQLITDLFTSIQPKEKWLNIIDTFFKGQSKPVSVSRQKEGELPQQQKTDLLYSAKLAVSSFSNIGYDFDGVLHFNVTPLLCYADKKCSRHPVNKDKHNQLKFTSQDQMQLNLSLLDYIRNSMHGKQHNAYIISSNPNIIHNINLLLPSYQQNPFAGIEYAPQDKLETIRKLKLDKYFDDSNYHLYRILDAANKTDLPEHLVKVFPEAVHSIFDMNTDNLPATNNPRYVTLSQNTDDLIRVFTYNINYQLQIGSDNLKNITIALGNAVNADYDFICLQESVNSIQDLFNHAGVTYENLNNYKEIAVKNIVKEAQKKEHQYTYFNHIKYKLEALCIGNLDVRDNDINKGEFNRPFTLLCLEDKTDTDNKIILINAHFPHTYKQKNEQIASYIDMFINAHKPSTIDKIKEYLMHGARVIMAGDFNRVIRGNTKPNAYDNSHYGLALFGGLDDIYRRPTILYNIMPNTNSFDKATCPGKMHGHIDAVLDSWGLQYKHEYPEVTKPASDHIPVVVSLLKGRLSLT